MSNLLLSQKYKDFIKCKAPVEFLEGTTAAGKTTVGIFKFFLKVAQSNKKYHIIASKDTGTAEKNIINKGLGVVDDFGFLQSTTAPVQRMKRYHTFCSIQTREIRLCMLWVMVIRKSGRRLWVVSMVACILMKSIQQI